jgi:hypothetical protein
MTRADGESTEQAIAVLHPDGSGTPVALGVADDEVALKVADIEELEDETAVLEYIVMRQDEPHFCVLSPAQVILHSELKAAAGGPGQSSLVRHAL